MRGWIEARHEVGIEPVEHVGLRWSVRAREIGGRGDEVIVFGIPGIVAGHAGGSHARGGDVGQAVGQGL